MKLAHVRSNSALTMVATERARRDGGYVLVMFGMLLVPLLLMVGLAVDVGSWYNRASDIQKAADAASLAGVIWLPNETKAREVALQTAKKNGFDNDDPFISVIAEKSLKAPRRLKVTIRDERVGSFFYEGLADRTIDMTRDSFAEYVTPVPMGSPRNYFGTGKLITSDPELLYQSVNTFCMAKANGDQHQSGHSAGSDLKGGKVTDANCKDVPSNPEFRNTGYEVYIELPDKRTSDVDVMLYDPRYNRSTLATQIQTGQTCVSPGLAYPTTDTGWFNPGGTANVMVNGPVEYQIRNNPGSPWQATQTLAADVTYVRRGDQLRYRSAQYSWTAGFADPPGTGSGNVTARGLRQYQTKSSSGGAWSATQTLDPTQSFTFRRDRIRTRTATYAKLPDVCTPKYTTINEAAIDSNQNGNNNTEAYTYRLFAADETTLDDSDNPEICTAIYDFDTAFDGNPYLGSRRWNKLCSIPSTAKAGKYILRVTNNLAKGNYADGSNQWGLVARYANAPGDGLCDARTDLTCPAVYGKESISVYANTTDGVAAFFLAEIGPEHAGKKLKIELFDPGEGGSSLAILEPTGPNSWAPHKFDWKGDNTGYGPEDDVLNVSVANSRFNARKLEITIDLTGYAPDADNEWWKIEYTFSDPDRPNVTDRTTWSARIIGDPVHLIEEN